MGDEAKPPPLEVRAQFHDLVDHLEGLEVAVPGDDPRVLVLHLAAAVPELDHELVDGGEDVEGLEAGAHERLVVVAGDELVGLAADDRRDVARAEETVEAHVGGVEDRLDGGDDRDVVAEDGEVLEAVRGGAQHRHGGRGRRRLEADGHEDHLLVRVLPGDLERVEGGVDHADVGALGLGVEERPPATGHPHHVAERRHDDVGLLGDGDGVVKAAHRDHADRAARAVDQGHTFGEVVLETVLVDGVGVPAADLHEAVLSTGLAQGSDLPRQGLSLLRIAEFIDKAQRCSPPMVAVIHGAPERRDLIRCSTPPVHRARRCRPDRRPPGTPVPLRPRPRRSSRGRTRRG